MKSESKKKLSLKRSFMTKNLSNLNSKSKKKSKLYTKENL